MPCRVGDVHRRQSMAEEQAVRGSAKFVLIPGQGWSLLILLSIEIKALVDGPTSRTSLHCCLTVRRKACPYGWDGKGAAYSSAREKARSRGEHSPRSAGCSLHRQLPRSLAGSPASGPGRRASSRSRSQVHGPDLAQVHREAVPVSQPGRKSGARHRDRKGAIRQAPLRTYARGIKVTGALQRHRLMSKIGTIIVA
jgi:hypothetical protein